MRRSRVACVVALLAASCLLLADPAFAAAGDLDPTFGGDGKAIVPIGMTTGKAVLVQPNGKIVLVGADMTVVRLHPNGGLDPRFGNDGLSELPFPLEKSFGFAEDAALQQNGKIVVVGESDHEFAVGRLRRDGSLDTEFNGDGVLLTNFGAKITGEKDRYDTATAVTMANGRIVVAGAVNRTDSWGLVRYLKDGTKDPSFGDGGRVLTPGVHYGLPSDIVVQPDGKILVAGGYQLARYNSDGSLDGSFGDAGIASVPVDAGANLALSLGPNGAILAGGNVGRRFALKRFTDDGVLDSTFGDDGVVTTGFGAMFDAIVRSMVVQSDGKIVLAGCRYHTFTGAPETTIARYEPDGKPDLGFGVNGRLVTMWETAGCTPFVALDPEGRLVAAGDRRNRGTLRLAAARYLTA